MIIPFITRLPSALETKDGMTLNVTWEAVPMKLVKQQIMIEQLLEKNGRLNS
jgi:hypothetical protein